MKTVLQGLLLGFAYVAPIGTQNLYVINSSLQRNKKKSIQTLIVVIFCDISLALACYLGIGTLISKSEIVKGIIYFLGCIIVCKIGFSLIVSSNREIEYKPINVSLMSVIISAFSVTWLNPQAIIDGSLLLGGFKSTLQGSENFYFILGFCIASMLWFTALTFLSYKLFSKMNKLIKYINIVCGSILIFYALKLGYSFLKLTMVYLQG